MSGSSDQLRGESISPLVTIVTPSYNQADYLAETIESVLAQDYPNIEYIVLDDGSTDHTPQVLERYTGRVRWERHANMGQSNTLNKGWSMARGELLGYLSSDDRLRTNCISRLVAAMREHGGAVVVYCDFTLIDSEGHPIRDVMTEDYSSDGLVRDLICYPGPGALFRRSLFVATGGWNSRLRQVPDFDFWLRASRYGTFRRVDSPLADFRVHLTSTSFRKVEQSRSDEIIGVVSDYWNGKGGQLEPHSKAMSYVLAARSHFISGRYATGLKRLGESLRCQPLTVFRPKTLRMLIAGLLRATYYDTLKRLRLFLGQAQ